MNRDTLIRSHWNCGQVLAFSALDGPTDYAHGLAGRTMESPAGIEITDPGHCRIRFLDEPKDRIVFGGDFFRFHGANGEVTAALLDAHHLLIRGSVELTATSAGIRHLVKGNLLLVGSAGAFQEDLIEADLDSAVEARGRWVLERKLPEGLSEAAQRTLQRALCLMKSQVYSPEGLIGHRWTTPDRWPHKDMWLWDTAFHAIGWRHVDPGLAMEMIEAMFDLQRDDGFLTYRGSCRGPAEHLGSLLTQPPVLACAVKKVYEKSGDLAWVERLFPRLEAYVEWDFKNRDTDGGGLMEWFIEDDLNCRSGESGMDNSPRFDSARKIDAVDFNSYLSGECVALSELGALLGQTAAVEKWETRKEALGVLINRHMWSEKEKFYCDYDPESGEILPILSSSGFLPIYGGAATAERSRCLADHLSNPDTFATAVPVPSIAVKDLEHYQKDMWRGPVWMNINWLIAEGFDRYGRTEQAQALRRASMREIERTCERFGTFFEYFDDRREVEPPDLLRKGENAPEINPFRQVIHDFGWTATLYVDLVFQAAQESTDGCFEEQK